MAEKDLPTFDPAEGEDGPQVVEVLGTAVTETINLTDVLTTADLTTSASFDLREIKQAEYGKLLQSVPIPVLFIDPRGTIVFVNKAVSIVAEDEWKILGTSFPELFPDAREIKHVTRILEAVFTERTPRTFKGVLKIGKQKIWGRTHLRSIRVKEQQLVLALVEDLTPEKRRLLLNEKYKKLVDLLSIGIVEFALTRPVTTELPREEALARILQARAVDGNAEFARIHRFGRINELLGTRLKQLFPLEGENRALYHTWIRRGFPICSAETKEASTRGTTCYLENTLIGIVKNTRLLGFWLAKRDITERQALREETLRAQKLESIGILAGGIAHDFNNILSGILGNINLARMWTNAQEKAYQRLVEAEKGVLRAKDLTTQLLTFAKGGSPVKKICDLKTLLRESATFALMGSNVGLQFSIPDDLRLVECDEGQISQVIQNVVINAGQAMPDGGQVEVGAENLAVTAEHGLPLSDGDYVKISVKDYGIGIPERYLSRVFDPYFTTKQKGSGLGLATAYSIVKSHQGFMNVESEVSAGSTFFVYLPASDKSASDETAPQDITLRGSGRILVMDDEEQVRTVVGEMLQLMGYKVVLAEEGKAAVELYRSAMNAGKPFDAVIMDLTVPGGMGGREAMKELLAIDPDAKAIVSSGYSTDPVMARPEEYGFKGVVAKPFHAGDLHDVLRKVMGESS
jgi:PAS domain S-box-containing protein